MDFHMFESRIDALYKILEDCVLCPRQCHMNRRAGQVGYCGAGSHLKVARVIPHFGEEPPVSGTKGSGTVFFSHCNLRCVFCQNFQISQLGMGEEMTPGDLKERLFFLQDSGCHNINLVTPTPFLPQIVEALVLAKREGLNIPIVYNTNGYDRVGILKLLEGMVDIYLPDAKYGSNEVAFFCSDTRDYVEHNIAALKEMKRQVDILRMNKEGIGERGLIIRHLVLPENGAETFSLLNTLKKEVGTGIHISLMGQYFPTYKVSERSHLNRRLTEKEFKKCCHILEMNGLENGWVQYPEEVNGYFLPDFTVQEGWN